MISQSSILWISFLPISFGLVSLYLWIHVKIHFDQLIKAGKQVAPQTEPPKKQNNPNPVNITIVGPPAPYPPYDKNYSVFDNGHPSINPGLVSQKNDGNITPVIISPKTSLDNQNKDV